MQSAYKILTMQDDIEALKSKTQRHEESFSFQMSSLKQHSDWFKFFNQLDQRITERISPWVKKIEEARDKILEAHRAQNRMQD